MTRGSATYVRKPSTHTKRLHELRTTGRTALTEVDRVLAEEWLTDLPGYRDLLRGRIERAVRARTAPPEGRACVGCGRDIRDSSYTEACEACWDRRRRRALRAREKAVQNGGCSE